MLDNFDQEEALSFVLTRMKKEAAFAGVPLEDLETIAKQVMQTDMKYMQVAQAQNEGVYDEDEAFDFIQSALTPGLDEETQALISLITDGYLEYFDEYLEENDLIDWD